MTRHHSFFILICVVICSLFVNNYKFNEYNALERVSFRVVDIRENNKSVTLVGDNITVSYFGEAKGIKPGDIVVCENLEKYSIQNKAYEEYLVSRGIFYSFSAKEVTLLTERTDIYTVSYNFRIFLSEKIERLYGAYSPLVKALIYGERNELDSEILDDFEKIGIIHILSLSGFHVGILIFGLNFFLSKLSFRNRAAVIIAILGFYIFVTGLRVSVIRSCAFYLIYFLSFIYNRRYSLFSTACITASIFLILNPFFLYDKGFVLSYLGVMSIALFNPLIKNFIKDEYKNYYITDILISTISAQILILPVSVYYFGTIPLSSVIANIIAIPLITAIVIIAIISIFISMIAYIRIIKMLVHTIAGLGILLQKTLFFIAREIVNLGFYVETSISKEVVVVLYVIIITIYILWERKVIKENLNDAKRDTCKVK